MTFKPGLHLASFAMYDRVSQSQSIFTVIEGPERENQVGFRGSTLSNGEARPSDIEFISDLFLEINSAARQRNAILDSLGKTRVNLINTFYVDNQPVETNSVIYPDLRSTGQYLIDTQMDGQSISLVALQLLNDGFAASTVVVVVAIGAGVLAAWYRVATGPPPPNATRTRVTLRLRNPFGSIELSNEVEYKAQ